MANQDIKIDQAQTMDILSILVPKFVQEQYFAGQSNMAENQPDVCVLFAYVCEFNEILKH